MSKLSQYEVVVGLEVHAQLMTKSKLFCSDSTYFGEEPNTQVSVISLAHPGTLPKMNKAAIELAAQCDATWRPPNGISNPGRVIANTASTGPW